LNDLTYFSLLKKKHIYFLKSIVVCGGMIFKKEMKMSKNISEKGFEKH